MSSSKLIPATWRVERDSDHACDQHDCFLWGNYCLSGWGVFGRNNVVRLLMLSPTPSILEIWSGRMDLKVDWKLPGLPGLKGRYQSPYFSTSSATWMVTSRAWLANLRVIRDSFQHSFKHRHCEKLADWSTETLWSYTEKPCLDIIG